jgi:hypothetical protein
MRKLSSCAPNQAPELLLAGYPTRDQGCKPRRYRLTDTYRPRGPKIQRRIKFKLLWSTSAL